MKPLQLLQHCHAQLKMPSKKPFFKSTKKYFREYCDLSTIHGLKYVGGNRTTAERGWWLIVLLLSLAFCSYCIYLVYEKWENSPIIISFANEETSIYEIPFPAVTICPVIESYNYGHTAIHFESLESLEIEYKSYMNLICDASSKEFKFNNKTNNIPFDDNVFNQEEFYNFIRNIIDIYPTLYVDWRNEFFLEEQLFDTILTDDGICLSFNLLSPKRIYKDNVQNYFFDRINNGRYDRSSNWSLDRGYSHNSGINAYPRRVSFSGAANGLNVNLLVKENYNHSFCKPLLSLQGFKVILHTPSTLPRLSQEHFYLPLNTAVKGGVKPVVMNTSEKVKKFEAEKRNCYFENEGSLKYFKEYTLNNCESDCLIRYTLYLCGCVSLYMPRDNITTICTNKKKKCMKKAEKRMFNKKLKWSSKNADNNKKPPQCHCLPSCRDISYEVVTSSTNTGPVIMSIGSELQRFSQSDLEIYFKRNHFIPMKRQFQTELGDLTDFLGNFGGLLGLFTGFSILSFMEIIYFLTIRILYNIRLYNEWSGKKDEESNS
ncbi:hypothetical protein ABEB36_007882 [Hypothenemus hampei]|uniref:Uncharacterized protein n=1 Tax=Hypothenemus hampei TaxID=57062 RepID=A0ABD1EVF8_HYPHA